MIISESVIHRAHFCFAKVTEILQGFVHICYSVLSASFFRNYVSVNKRLLLFLLAKTPEGKHKLSPTFAHKIFDFVCKSERKVPSKISLRQGVAHFRVLSFAEHAKVCNIFGCYAYPKLRSGKPKANFKLSLCSLSPTRNAVPGRRKCELDAIFFPKANL